MVFYPSENHSNKPGGSNPSLPAFDLRAEKQRIGEGTEEIRKELLVAWQKKYGKAQIFPAKLSAANPELVELLLSFQNTLSYNDLAKKFGFSQEQRDVLPQIIWNIALAKNWYGLESLLQSELKINASVAGQIAIIINQNILFKAKELSEKAFAPKRLFTETKEEQGTEKISIQEAIRKYPELGEQLITSERIILKSFPSPVRPSIKNWLADYNFVMGYEQARSGIERTNYLFHNINTQKLNPAEREKVASLLKSFDENYPLTVNKNTRQVIFPPMAPKPAPKPAEVPRPMETPRSQPVVPQPVAPPRFTPPSPQFSPQVREEARFSAPSSPPPAPPRTASLPSRQPAQPSARPAFHTTQPSRPTAPLPQGRLEIKQPPSIAKKEDSHVRFTSPQTLPVERDDKGQLQPYRITPFSGTGPKEESPEKDTKPAKNIINLKE